MRPLQPQRRVAAGEASRSPAGNNNRRVEVRKLLSVLPNRLVRGITEAGIAEEDVVEIVLDFGRRPFARARSGDSPRRGVDVPLSAQAVSREELDWIVDHCSDFAEDNRSGIDGTLHRISAIKNRAGKIVGITCRVGEAVEGSAEMVKDIVLDGHSVLLLGRPGVGKTTAIREISRILADEAFRRVVIVDTSNEIGGDGDVAHVGIGRSRRMQVASTSQQHRVMIEAVENHTPNVIIIDEIGTVDESLAARTISQRGVQLIATAHGNVLENIIKNPSLNDVVGSISSVTLGDEESRRRGVQKSVLERSAPPTFDVVVEMIDRDHWNIHPNVAESVDNILRGKEPPSIMREITDGKVVQSSADAIIEARGELMASKSIMMNQRRLFGGEPRNVSPEVDEASLEALGDGTREEEEEEEERREGSALALKKEKRRQLTAPSPGDDALRIFIEGIDADIMDVVRSEMTSETRLKLVAEVEEAQAVLTTRAGLKENAYLREVAKYSRMPLFLVRAGTKSSVLKGINKLLSNDMMPAANNRLHANNDGTVGGSVSPLLRATGGVLECKTAIDDIVMKKKMPVELVPNSAETMMRLIAVANENGLEHEVIGSRLRVMPNEWTATRVVRKNSRRAAKLEFW
jgi:stage III sporulation protein SpoIIIAA